MTKRNRRNSVVTNSLLKINIMPSVLIRGRNDWNQCRNKRNPSKIWKQWMKHHSKKQEMLAGSIVIPKDAMRYFDVVFLKQKIHEKISIYKICNSISILGKIEVKHCSFFFLKKSDWEKRLISEVNFELQCFLQNSTCLLNFRLFASSFTLLQLWAEITLVL